MKKFFAAAFIFSSGLNAASLFDQTKAAGLPRVSLAMPSDANGNYVSPSSSTTDQAAYDKLTTAAEMIYNSVKGGYVRQNGAAGSAVYVSGAVGANPNNYLDSAPGFAAAYDADAAPGAWIQRFLPPTAGETAISFCAVTHNANSGGASLAVSSSSYISSGAFLSPTSSGVLTVCNNTTVTARLYMANSASGPSEFTINHGRPIPIGACVTLTMGEFTCYPFVFTNSPTAVGAPGIDMLFVHANNLTSTGY